MTEPIAVVGAAGRFPGADNLDAYWDLIREGRVATGRVSADRWRHERVHTPDDLRAADGSYTDVVAHLSHVDSFPAQRYALPPRRVEVTDPQHRLLVELADDALRDAALDGLPGERTGVYVGASVSEYKDLLTSRIRAGQMAAGEFGAALGAEAARAAVFGVVPPRAYTIPGTLLNMAAATVSSVFDLGGPSFVVDAACASALVALHEAVLHLRGRQCDVALAGGVYLNLVPDNLIGFSRIGALSRGGVCRPFDRRADGFVLGEGAGFVVLKRLADAERDGDGVYALIRGTGCANDGRSDGPMTPRPEGQAASLRLAYADAGVDPRSIGFVECHGTATPTGDAVELATLRQVFGPDATPYVSSVKANIGHTMSAAGIAGLLKAILVLRYAAIPPQVGCEQPDPSLGGLRVASRCLPWESTSDGVRRAAVSSFGFGGTNVHVVLEEAPTPRTDRASRAVQPGERYWAVVRGGPPRAAGPPPATGAEPAALPATTSAEPAAPSTSLLAAISAVSDHPPETLAADQTLVGDLGFDSLMIAELEGHLAQAYSTVDSLPPELLRPDVTIGDLASWLRTLGEPENPQRGAPTPTPTPVGPAYRDGRSLPEGRFLPDGWFRLDSRSLPEVVAFRERLAEPARIGLPNPYFVVQDGPPGATTRIDGTELIDFSGYDYLGFATDPEVVAAAQEAVGRYGTSVSASRIASGERPLHRDLEQAIAELLGTEAALVMVSGHATNVGVLGNLLRPGDLALHDALAHDSIIQGIRLAGARRRPFPHNDIQALDRMLTELAPRHSRVLVAVEGVYSMDGDLADLPALIQLRERHGFLLYVDEAHSLGVLGTTGRGAREHWGVAATDIDLWMGTLSKALASCGGYVAGRAELVDYLRYTTPGFVFSVGLPPASTAAALAAIRRLVAEPDRVARLRANADSFRRLAREAGIDTGASVAAVVPVVTGNSTRALLLAGAMRSYGVNVAPIVHPAVEEDGARLRFFLNAGHTPAHIRTAIDSLAREIRAQDW